MKRRLAILLILGMAVFVGSCSEDDTNNSSYDGSGPNKEEECHGCMIDYRCYDQEDRNPENPCLRCEADNHSTEWTPVDGEACDDGLYCNGEDTCKKGVCSVHAGDPCPDDELYCNGAESCSEKLRSCVHSGSPCDPYACDEDEELCTGPFSLCSQKTSSFPCLDGLCVKWLEDSSWVETSGDEIFECLGIESIPSDAFLMRVEFDYKAAADTCYDQPYFQIDNHLKRIDFGFHCSSEGTDTVEVPLAAGMNPSNFIFGVFSGDWGSTVRVSAVSFDTDTHANH